MPAKKSKTPMTGAQRFAKDAAKMTDANQEQWSSKMKEKRANYLAIMSEQQKDAMRKRDKVRKKGLFSDGAAQHFKQSFFFNAVIRLPKLLGVEHLKIIYDFPATSHGKGVVDGIEGTTKRGENNFFLPFFI